MNERLIIDNFAGVKHLELDLRMINIFIGPQATGKSVCAKLLYLFKGFLLDAFRAAVDKKNKPNLDKSFLERFYEYFPPGCLVDGKFSLRYEIGEAFIEISNANYPKTAPKLFYSDDYYKEFKLIKNEIKKADDENQNRAIEEPRSVVRDVMKALLDDASDRLGVQAGFMNYFIPAGRSFFSYIDTNIYEFLSNKDDIDPFLIEFGRLYGAMKKMPEKILRGDDKNSAYISMVEKITESILHGKHILEKARDYLKLSDERLVSLMYASSGQQEVLPLAITLLRLPLYGPFNRGLSICIEEPETHLFPASQKAIVQLLAVVHGYSKTPLQYTITTHSPYILTSFNNLMQAGHLRASLPESEHARLYEIVPREQVIEPKHVAAYAFDNGTAVNICSPDTGLILADAIDEVSNDLSIQFGALLDLE